MHDQRMPIRWLASQSGGRIALGIEIDQHRAAAGFGQSDGDIDRRGRFPDAAFLVRDTQNAAHRFAPLAIHFPSHLRGRGL